MDQQVVCPGAHDVLVPGSDGAGAGSTGGVTTMGDGSGAGAGIGPTGAGAGAGAAGGGVYVAGGLTGSLGWKCSG